VFICLHVPKGSSVCRTVTFLVISLLNIMTSAVSSLCGMATDDTGYNQVSDLDEARD
jgi:hypothetical protein